LKGSDVKPSNKAHLLTAIACLGIAGAFGGAVMAAGPLTPAQAITARQAGFKAQGAAFKTIADQLKAPTPDIAAIRQAANVLNANAGQIGSWFPAGSGPETGIRMRAKAEIWTNPSGFATAVNNFRAAAPRLKAAADSGDAAAIGAQFRATAQTCGGCHHDFRADEH
jgi:cytochrome c556